MNTNERLKKAILEQEKVDRWVEDTPDVIAVDLISLELRCINMSLLAIADRLAAGLEVDTGQ